MISVVHPFNLAQKMDYLIHFVIASKAKQSSSDGGTGLLRFARNDDSIYRDF